MPAGSRSPFLPLALIGFVLLSATLPVAAEQQGDFTYSSDGSAITITGYTGLGGTVAIPGAIADLPVTSVGASAFHGCASLSGVTVPASVTCIGDSAFEGCTSLANVTIGNGVTSIGDSAFRNCTRLGSVTLPASVTRIGAYAFASCTGLTSANLSASITSLGGSAFYKCSGLTSVVIPDSVISIGTEAFLMCTKLTRVTIGSGVSSMGNFAFEYCTSLASAEFLGDAPGMGVAVFHGCAGGFTVRYAASKAGFTSPTWKGYASASRILTIAAKDRSKNRGDTVIFAGTEFTASGLLSGDAVTRVTLTSTGAPAEATAAAGPYPIVPSAAIGIGLDHYTIAYVNGTLTVAKAAQTIAFDSGPLPNRVVGQAPFELTATATSGLPVAFASSSPAVATVAGNVVTIVGAGRTTITASQSGDENWSPAAAVSRDLMVLVAPPDFVVTEIRLDPAVPAIGSSFTASVTVQNIGAKAGSAGYLHVWLDRAGDAAVGLAGDTSVSVGSLRPGQSKALRLKALKAGAGVGPRTFRAFVDARNATAESDEGNNQRILAWHAGQPDFVITQIQFAPDPVTCGKTFTAYVTVQNTGAASGDAGSLDLWLNRAAAPVAGPTVRGDKNTSVGTLAAGQAKQLRFTSLRTSGSPEARVFRALVDSRNKTVESDETNNQSTRDYSCAPSP